MAKWYAHLDNKHVDVMTTTNATPHPPERHVYILLLQIVEVKLVSVSIYQNRPWGLRPILLCFSKLC